MSDHLEFTRLSPRQPPSGGVIQPQTSGAVELSRHPLNGAGAPVLPLEIPVVVEAVLARWPRLLAGGAVLAVVSFALAWRAMDSDYSAPVQFIRCEPLVAGDSFKPQRFSLRTLAAMLQNAGLLEQVASQTDPPMPPGRLARGLKVTADHNGELLTVTIPGATPEGAVEQANRYASLAVEFGRQMQARDALGEQVLLKQQLERIESDLAVLNRELHSLPHASLHLSERQQSLSNNLETARAQLANFKPLFNQDQRRQQQLKKVAALEQQQYVINQIKTMEGNRLRVSARERMARLVAQNPPGYYRLFAPAKPGDVRALHPRLKIAALTLFGALAGGLVMAGLVVARELFDDRLKTANDVAGVSQLPVLATLGDLRRLKPAARTVWSVRAWSALQPQLIPLPGGALVCGIISSRSGEGRSTWLGLLAQAASERGFRVLAVATHSLPDDFADEAETGKDGGQGALPVPNVLTSSSQVTERLIRRDSDALLQISLPRWSWTFKRRQQWQAALEQWSRIDHLVILVELPPLSAPESPLLAETVANVFWLVDAGRTTARELREQLAELRQARCNVVGAGLNHEPASLHSIRVLQPVPATGGVAA